MANLIQTARDQVAELTQKAYEKAAAQGLLPQGETIRGTVEVPKDSRNGDFASSFAMAGAKALKMAPRAIAQIILDNLELEGTLFQRAEIAGPGFLNFFPRRRRSFPDMGKRRTLPLKKPIIPTYKKKRREETV